MENVFLNYKEDYMTTSRDKELAKHALDLKLRHLETLAEGVKERYKS
jgi:hypothetical protein